MRRCGHFRRGVDGVVNDHRASPNGVDSDVLRLDAFKRVGDRCLEASLKCSQLGGAVGDVGDRNGVLQSTGGRFQTIASVIVSVCARASAIVSP